MDDSDPVMKMYEAQAIVIEKEAEIEELRRRIKEMDRERQERNRVDRMERRLEEIVARLDRNEAGNAQKGMEELKAANSNMIERTPTLEGRIKGGNETILIMGGERDKVKMDEMIILGRKTSKWKVLYLKLPCKNSHGGSALLKDQIYIFGGTELKKKLYKLDSQQMRWIKLAEMNEGRQCINNSSLAFQGCIWVFGGLKESEVLDTVEKYCPERNGWIKMPGMSQRRYAAAAAVCNEKIFVSGGNNWTSLVNVECFDPTSGVWTPVVDMPGGRNGHSMISDGSSLFVMGGLDFRISSMFSAVVWRVIPPSEKAFWRIRPSEEKAIWKELPPMNELRRYFTTKYLCCSTSDYKKEIYAIGGHSGQEYLASVEIFDGERWREGPKLPYGCHSMSSVVIPSSLAETLLFF